MIDFGRAVNYIPKWRRVETTLEAKASNVNASLQITTTTKGIHWLDQVSAMPVDTHKVRINYDKIFNHSVNFDFKSITPHKLMKIAIKYHEGWFELYGQCRLIVINNFNIYI